MIGEHVKRHHASALPTAVVGPCLPPATGAEPTQFGLSVRNWWIDHTARLSGPGALDFTDVGTGNLSLPRLTFLELGGFDTLPRREDWEFGYRLLQAEVHLAEAVDAAVTHDLDVDLASSLADRKAEGMGDFRFAQAHPEAAHRLPLWAWIGFSRSVHAVVTGVFLRPRAGDLLVSAALPVLTVLDRAGSRRFPRRYGQATLVAYWSGVAEAAGSESAFLATLARSPAWTQAEGPPTQTIELSEQRWQPLMTITTEVDVTVAGHHLATVPSNLGGFPWSRQQFSDNIHQTVRGRLVRVLSEGPS